MKRIRWYKRAVIDAARSMLGYPYVLGGWGKPNTNPPYGVDCRALVQMSFKDIGARDLVGGIQHTVRSMWAWARANARTRSEGVRGDVIVYHEPAKMPEPGNPLAIRHTGILIQPPSKRWPKGLAISAVNPKLDVKEHELLMNDLGINHLAVLGYIHPDWESLIVDEPPMTDPEPPVAVRRRKCQSHSFSE